MKTQILYVITHYHSTRDTNGNTYWAARIYRTRDGKSICFTSPHNSNTEGGVKKLAGDVWGRHTSSMTELGSRCFSQTTKSWPYAGCRSDDIAKYIRKAFKTA